MSVTVHFKIFGDDTIYTFGTFDPSVVPAVIVALAGRVNVCQVWSEP